MKKHLLIICLLAFMMPLSAETLTICKTFEKLLKHVNDFSPIMLKDSDSFFSTPSSIQMEGAKSSQIMTLFGDVKFQAELGGFKTKKEASDSYTKWKNALMACYPGMNFSIEMYNDPDNQVDYTYFYPFIKNETFIRLYEAYFNITKIGSEYDLSFIFPQMQEASLLNNEVPAYTDFTLITQDKVDSPFGKALFEVFAHSVNDFGEIMGDLSLDDVTKEDLAYDATFKLPGYSSCLIKQNTNKKFSYVVNLCTDVDKATFESNMTAFLKQLMSAMGRDYAYKRSANGKSIRFVPVDGPTDTVASFSYSEKSGKYSAQFVVYAL